jgi:protein-S-isoprenylcysteine O-methyltransferase Ste14
MKLHWVDIAVYLIYLALFGLAIVTGPRSTLWYVALCLSAVCAVIWFVARWQLGDAFSVAPEARQLVTRGLYSRIRHPIYVFGTLAFLFLVLALMGWFALVIWLVVILIQVRRARREERVLAEIFGDEYTTYRSRTWF